MEGAGNLQRANVRPGVLMASRPVCWNKYKTTLKRRRLEVTKPVNE